MRRRRPPEVTGHPSFPGYGEVEEIGAGAFATVFRARELDTNRPVALKVLRLADTRPQVLDTFRQETLAHGSVSSHPHILTLHRSFPLPDGRPVLVLELCQGSLAERIRRTGPLPAEEAVAVGVKVGGALETAHRAGMLHRDVKPQNLLVTSYGEPVLADFGIAQLQAASQGTEGVFGFTTLHAPPELLEGRPVTARTDVYELASTLYQLLTGRAAFAAFEGEAPASVILRILQDPVAPLVRPDVPLSLSDLLVRALAKDPEERPASALELVEGLQAVQREAGWAVTPVAVLGDQPDHPPAPEPPVAPAPPPPPAPVPPPPVPPGAAAPPPPPPPPNPSPASPSPPPSSPPAASAPPPAPAPGDRHAEADGPARVGPPSPPRAVVAPELGVPGADGPSLPPPAPVPPPPGPPAAAAPSRQGPEFVMPADTTSRPAVERPFEQTIASLGAAGRFVAPAASEEASPGRPGWVVPLLVLAVVALVAALALLI